ncbi:acyl-CoA thioesterase [Algisphaera agarilytica]|uniref:Acyl-CoA thioester hydrolase n=1 Tax=Algisphaera agarilytica TaxID=1385975 RepID=A0A7X0LLV7_9BACT|nr:thioesterase family protein [Algisphaera agarilytica]MBB6431324.1 acyl-CoA thioester hydrolase [Algisphaera agarilytica]
MSEKLHQITVPIRVRYQECDPMNVAHHSVYPVWLEIARTELLRSMGQTYRDLEAAGVFLVVAKLSLRYRRPAMYDDELEVSVTALPTVGVKLEHRYEIRRGKDLIAAAETTLACVDGDGKLRPVPEKVLNPGP